MSTLLKQGDLDSVLSAVEFLISPKNNYLTGQCSLSGGAIFMRNSILILGGGFDQLPAVHSVNKLGYASIVADFNENCISSTCHDLFIHKSNRDVEGIYEELNKYKNKYKGIILVFVIGTDIPVEACLLNDKFNIKSGFSIDIAKLSVDKIKFKKTLRKLKFNVPNVELYDKNKDYEFPLVVKPNELAGSRGVLLSRSKNEFNDNINFIKNNYSNSQR